MVFGILALLSIICLGNAQSTDSSTASAGVVGGKCTETVLTIAVNATNLNLVLDPPKDQQVLTDLFLRLTSDPASVIGEVVKGNVENSATYKIWTQLCLPTTQDDKKTVELAVAGYELLHIHSMIGRDLTDLGSQHRLRPHLLEYWGIRLEV
jgi:hypothetical protein